MYSCPFSLFLSFHLSLLPSCPITTSPSFLFCLFSLLPYCPLSSSVLAGFFLGPKKDSRGPFVEFVKAHNEEQSQYLLLQLRDHHVRPEKWEAFLDAYNAVEPWVSVLSAIEKGSYSLPACLSTNPRIYLHPSRLRRVCLPPYPMLCIFMAPCVWRLSCHPPTQSLTSSCPHSLRIGYIGKGNEQQRRVPEFSILHQPIF